MIAWSGEYAKMIFGKAPKKKIKFETFRLYLYEMNAVGRIEALEDVLNIIKKDPDGDLDIIQGEIHIMLTNIMKELNRKSDLRLKVSLEETLKRQELL